MSLFFAEEVDNVTFGIQGSNVAETMQISSTTDNVYMRFYTNNFTDVENLSTGAVIGFSNYDSENGNLYFGQIQSNVDDAQITRTMVISEDLIEVIGDLSVYGNILPASNVGFDLGSPDLRFRDLYLSGNTIFIGSGSIQQTEDGRITIIGASGKQELEISSITTNDPDGFIDLNNNIFSNVQSMITSNIVVTAEASINAITTDNSDGLDMSGITLSNIGVVDTQVLTNKTNPLIDVDGCSLSNISNVQTTSISGNNDTVDMTANSLSNVGDVKLNVDATLSTNNLVSVSGSAINMQNSDIVNVRDIIISGSIHASGEFFVTDTTTCNTNQLVIDNDGTGPALVVNQQGFRDIMQVQDDGNTVFFIKDGGQAAFGGFGQFESSGIPDAQVYILNTPQSNTTAFYVDQQHVSEDILVLRGPSATSSDTVIVSNSGSFGVGTQIPDAKLHVVGTNNLQPAILVHTSIGSPAFAVDAGTGNVGIGTSSPTAVLEVNAGANTTTPIISVHSDATPNAFSMNADGEIGVATTPEVGITLAIAGTARIENLIIGASGDSTGSTDLLISNGIQAPNTRDFLLFGGNNFSNVNDVYAERIAIQDKGTQEAPTYTFRTDDDTGLFSPSEDALSITTAGVQRVHVNALGNVEIGNASTTTADIKLSIYSTDAILVPVGTTAQRPTTSKAGYVRFNSELQTFEGYGPGDVWGSLGGVKSSDQITFISAEEFPGKRDGNIRFVNCNVETIRITPEGRLGIGTTDPDVSLTIDATDAIMLPAGINDERPLSARQGYIRYNTETLQFEGYGAGNAWGSLGGVKSVDQKTFISAELAAGLSDDTLRFVADDRLLMSISANASCNVNIFADTSITGDANIAGNATIDGAATISGVQFNSRTLCNVSTLHLDTVTSTSDSIDISNKTLSNVNRVITQNLIGTPTGTGNTVINAEGTTLSNLDNLEVSQITTASSSINLSTKGLSNVGTIEAQTISTKTLTNTDGTNSIDVDGKDLVNIARVETSILASSSGTLDLLTTNLNNVGDIHVTSSNVIYVSKLSSADNSVTIDFSQNDLSNIRDMEVGGNFTVGAFTVTESNTVSKQQFKIENDGTLGPALIVQQSGTNDIMKVMDDDTVVMFIKDGGNMVVGEGEVPNSTPDAQLYVYNNVHSNQPVLLVSQSFPNQPTLQLSGSANSTIVFSDDGKMGMGNTSPVARIDVINIDTTTQFLRYASAANSDAFVIDADGRLGVNAAPNVGNAVTVTGITQSDTLVAKTNIKTNVLTTDSGNVIDVSGTTLSNVALLHLSTLTTDNTNSAIDVSFKSLSNIDTVNATLLKGTTTDTANLTVNKIQEVSGSINFSSSTLSNIAVVDTAKLTNTSPNIDVDGKTLSNVTGIDVQNVFNATTSSINFINNTLSNVNTVITNNVTSLNQQINFDANELSNVGSLRTPIITSTAGQDHIDFQNTILCNVDAIDVQTIENKDGATIDFVQNTLSNVAVLEVTTINNANADHINVSNKALSNLGNVLLNSSSILEVDTITTVNSIASNIDLSGRHLTNVDTLATTNVFTDVLTTSSTTGTIDVDDKTLSNVAVLEVDSITNAVADHINFNNLTLSNVNALQTDNLTTLSATNTINVNSKSLSNVDSLELAQLTTTSLNGFIDVNEKGFSNVSSLEVQKFENATQDFIDFSGLSLSNVSIVRTTILSSDAPVIDVDGKSLSNITTVELTNLTTTAADGSINVDGKSLSNVAVLEVATVTTADIQGIIDVSGKTLSNLTRVASTSLNVDSIATLIDQNINFNAATLSNVGTIDVDSITNVRANHIDFNDKAFSNVLLVDTPTITNLSGTSIDISAKTLSNITTVSAQNVETNTINTTAIGGVIDVTNNTLSNVAVLEVDTITNDSTDHINVSTKGLSNLGNIKLNTGAILETDTITTVGSLATDIDFSTRNLTNVTTLNATNVTTDVLTTSAFMGIINVDGKSLSNVSFLEVDILTTRSTNGDRINVDGKSLSNINTVEAVNLTSATDTINVSTKSLSNLGDVKLLSDSTIFVNQLSSIGPSTVITFGGNNLDGINDLTIAGKLTIGGDFKVMETTTSNTNQLVIQNDGTGPALVVNQTGNNDILKVMDDGMVVLYIQDGGNMVVGDFDATELPNDVPNAQLFVYNNVHSNQPALLVEQRFSTQPTLKLIGTTNDPNDLVVFSGDGKMGIGNASPAARIDVINSDSTTQLLHYASASNSDAFVVHADGRLGVNADPTSINNLGNAVTVTGITQSDTFVATTNVKTNVLTTKSGTIIDVSANTLSNVSLLRLSTLTTDNANGAIDINFKSLSNIDTLEVNTFNAAYTTNTSNLTVDTVRAAASNSTINFTSSTLSNIAIIDTGIITNASGPNINIDTKTLSNVTSVDVQNVLNANTSTINFVNNSLSNVNTLNTINITSPTDHINVSAKTLSNVTSLDVEKVRNVFSGILDFDANTLSNVGSLHTPVIRSSTSQNHIDFQDTLLCNVGSLDVPIIENRDAAKINFVQNTLSNVAILEVGTITNANANHINVSAKTLSNVSTLDVTTIRNVNTSILNFGANTLSNVNTLRTSAITSLVTQGNIDFQETTLLNVGSLDVPIIEDKGFGSIDFVQNTLSNVGILEVDTITNANADFINMSANMLSNVAVLDVTTIRNVGTGVLDFVDNTLSNVGALHTPIITSPVGQEHIDIQDTILCNVGSLDVPIIENRQSGSINFVQNTLSNISVLDVNTITNANATDINLSNKTLSNLGDILLNSSSKLEVDTITTVGSLVPNINFSGRHLSNVTTLNTVNVFTDVLTTSAISGIINVDNKTLSNVALLEVDSIKNATASTIDFNNQTLSNVSKIQTGILTTLDPNNTINVDGKSLSNINSLELAQLTTTAVNGLIDVNGKSLSNIDIVEFNTSIGNDVIVTSITLDKVTTNSPQIDFNATFLSNIAIVDTAKLTHSLGATIDVDAKTLSNVASISTPLITSDTANIGFDAKTLSNINTIDVTNLTNFTNNYINISNKSLSNVSLLQTAAITSMGTSFIDFSSNSLSNINTAFSTNTHTNTIATHTGTAVTVNSDLVVNGSNKLAIDTLDTSSITSNVINVSFNTLSNLDNVDSSSITTDKLTTRNLIGVIDVDALTLSNVSSIRTDILTSDNANITTVALTNLTTTNASGFISVQNKSFSNLGNVFIDSGGVLATNTITSSTSAIDFDNNDVTGVNNLVVGGEFFVTTGTTCNTNPFIIDNANSGPALVVNQQGANNIINVMDDDTTVFYVQDRGTAAFGVFHDGIQTTPKARLLVQNPYSSNEIAMLIHQDEPSKPGLDVFMGTESTAKFSVTQRGAIATLVATNTIDSVVSHGVINASATTLSNISTISVGKITHTSGIVNFNNNTLSNINTLSSSKALTNTIASINTLNTIDFSSSTLSNVNILRTQSIQTTSINPSPSISNTITCGSALHIQGFSSLLGSDIVDTTFGSDAIANTEIGLRVDKNMLSPAFLSISDKRVKTDIIPSPQQEDLDTLLAIPVSRYKFIDGDNSTVNGFIAQEVETHAPFAVRTTVGVIPNIMQMPSAILIDGYGDETIVELKHAHNLDKNNTNTIIKLLIDGNDVMAKVVEIVDANIFRINKRIMGDTIFVYGTVVPDFKLLDSDRLVPIVFNAVKALHAQNAKLQSTLSDVLKRLEALEANKK